MAKKEKDKLDKLVAISKSRGIIFPGSEIYGGLANTWDYGPVGVEIKNNIKKLWWKKFVQESTLNVGLDSSILMNPKTWEASGHLDGFNDPLMDCKKCKTRYRADKLIEDFMRSQDDETVVDGWSNDKLKAFIEKNNISCPNCGSKEFTDIREFNLMFKTFQGVTEDSQSEIFLRPETAQGIFVNFRNIARTSRKKIPFGIGQIGKSFRNEITPGNFIFRTREFEQMELEFFCEPGEDIKWFNYWKEFCINWLHELDMNPENLRFRDHDEDELSHYSNATSDIEYKFPFGWGELWGIADRTDFDLKQHQEHSNQDMHYTDPYNGSKYIPYCIEPALGVDRLMLAILIDAYKEEKLENGKERIVLNLHPSISAFKAAIFPLTKKLNEQAEEVFHELSKYFNVDYDDSGSIGKRYRRHDEIGTPYCITYDFDSLEDGCVTVRDRDTMEQKRVKIDELKSYVEKRIKL